MPNKKNLQIGDLVYFESYKNDIGIIVDNRYIDPVLLHDVFWFKSLKHGTHSDFYLHKAKRVY